jgi:hypothetical protein
MYIPDMTERFPEGLGGVDMTPSYFGEPVDYSRAYKEDDYEEEYEETPSEPRIFEVGNEYREVGIYGGVTYYTVEEIDRKNKKILLSEEWHDVDGSGTRPSKWHKLEVDEQGNERALEWTSQIYGDFWIYA